MLLIQQPKAVMTPSMAVPEMTSLLPARAMTRFMAVPEMMSFPQAAVTIPLCLMC